MVVRLHDLKVDLESDFWTEDNTGTLWNPYSVPYAFWKLVASSDALKFPYTGFWRNQVRIS